MMMIISAHYSILLSCHPNFINYYFAIAYSHCVKQQRDNNRDNNRDNDKDNDSDNDSNDDSNDEKRCNNEKGDNKRYTTT
jgi:hypothetical protein